MSFQEVPNLPFMFKRDNVARYEDGHVFILDRRIYPFEVEFVQCKTYEDTAKAIEDMVTQSGGPGTAAGFGMVQAAHQYADLAGKAMLTSLRNAADRLIATRPTNNHTKLVVNHMYGVAEEAISNSINVESRLLDEMDRMFEERQIFGLALAEAAATVIKDGDTILNHCWAESGIIYTLYVAIKQGKKICRD